MQQEAEEARRRRDEVRDPAVQQLRAMLDAFQRREDMQRPITDQLTSLAGMLRDCTTQLQAQNGEIEKTVQRNVNGLVIYSCILLVVLVCFSKSDQYCYSNKNTVPF